MASIVCEVCSAALTAKEGHCMRMWHTVKGEVLPPHEPLSEPGMAYPCPEDPKEPDDSRT
jgi:hypothetical protein